MTDNNQAAVEQELPEQSQPDTQDAEIEIEIEGDGGEEDQPQQQDQHNDDDFDPRERVEINDPKVQKKFNHLYKQVKMSDDRNKFQMDMLQKAMEKITELESRFSQTDVAEAERILKGRLKEARDNGDDEAETRILDEIISFKVDSKLKGKDSPKEKPKQEAAMPLDDDAKYVMQWAQETDDNGNPLRPWIAADHPQHKDMMRIAAIRAAEMNAENGYVDIQEIMQKVEQDMSKKTRAPQSNSRIPDPMRGSNLTKPPLRGKIKLSQQEVAIARKLGVPPEVYAKNKG